MFSKLTLIIACCLFFSCSSERKASLAINFSPDSTAIIFSGLDEVSLFRAKEQADSLSNELFSVIEMSAESMEKEIVGKTFIKDNTLTFVPDSPLVKGKTYLVQTLLNSSFGKTADILKSDVGRTIKRQEKILER
ncbi:MAG: hypothetical protein EOP00_27360 [Pedobacter sp.]|nr:MAG: hypothetical protein EOP00_27360 [Pedobacter sp.]